MATKLKEFTLSISLEGFITEFWLDISWYEKFLTEKLLDLSVEIEPWIQGDKATVKSRKVKSFHPSKVSFPGLPSHAESLKTQELEMFESVKKAVIKESNSFRGIPYAEYFSVNTVWTVVEVGSNQPDPTCKIVIELDVVFHYSTWLSGTIRSNTAAELQDVFNIWEQYAEHTLQTKQALKNSTKVNSLEEGQQVRARSKSSSRESDDHKEGIAVVVAGDGGHWKEGDELYDKDSSLGEEDDLLFYECEEGDEFEDESSSLLNRQQATFFRTNSAAELRGFYSSKVGYRPSDELPSAHAMAVHFVETTFVFAEFSFWQVHNFYNKELKEIFDVSPLEILYRISNSFIPGKHSAILSKPDMYGPIIAVMSLPQVLLLSLEVHRSGCSQSSLLGNAVIVSLCLWIGLSLMYRILAYFIAPKLDLRRCLSITGYSFFAWNLSLLLSYPIEAFQEVSYVPAALPLVVFGLPSAIAQGCMMWDYTPAGVSSPVSPSGGSAGASSARSHRSDSRSAYCKLFCSEMKSQFCSRIIWVIPKVSPPCHNESTACCLQSCCYRITHRNSIVLDYRIFNRGWYALPILMVCCPRFSARATTNL
jgi:hypothetical protein